MKVEGVIVHDTKSNSFFAFIRQFPGICAQGNSVKEVSIKIDTYFKLYIDKMKDQDVEMDEHDIIFA